MDGPVGEPNPHGDEVGDKTKCVCKFCTKLEQDPDFIAAARALGAPVCSTWSPTFDNLHDERLPPYVNIRSRYVPDGEGYTIVMDRAIFFEDMIVNGDHVEGYFQGENDPEDGDNWEMVAEREERCKLVQGVQACRLCSREPVISQRLPPGLDLDFTEDVQEISDAKGCKLRDLDFSYSDLETIAKVLRNHKAGAGHSLSQRYATLLAHPKGCHQHPAVFIPLCEVLYSQDFESLLYESIKLNKLSLQWRWDFEAAYARITTP